MINKVVLVGRIGKVSWSGKGPTAISVATNRWEKGEQKTEWHRVIFWPTTEVEEVKVGDQVYVEGELRTRSWTTKGGERKYITEVCITDVAAGGLRLLARPGVMGMGVSDPPEERSEDDDAPVLPDPYYGSM